MRKAYKFEGAHYGLIIKISYMETHLLYEGFGRGVIARIASAIC